MTIRRLAAIFAADVAGFSAMMERDEEGTAARIRALRRDVIEPLLSKHQGRLIKTSGDGFLAEFASPVEAVRSAIAMQDQLAGGEQADHPVRLRIGINLGDIIIEDDGDVFGDGVNIAARLEQVAEPGWIAISGSVHEQVAGKIDRSFEDKGEQQVKNIARPIRVYSPAGPRTPKADESKPLPLPDKPSIAVLPFTNMSGDPEQEYLADGIVEDIITALSRVRWFFVIARNSSFTYKGKAVDVRQVGRELGVGYVLEGSVRRMGTRVRITGQLIDAANGRHLWADRFDGGFDDLFDLQDRITESVVGAIEPNIQHAEIKRATLKSTTNVTAYDHLLCALPLMGAATQKNIQSAQGLLTKALEADPEYAYAMALLATCYRNKIVQNCGTIDDAREGLRLARAAVTVGSNDPLVLAEAAQSIAYFARDYDGAASAMQRSLNLHPASAATHGKAGWLRNYMEEPQRAKMHFDTAMRLSPIDIERFRFLSGYAVAHQQLEEHGEGRVSADRALELNPNWATAHRAKVVCLVNLGLIDEARQAATLMLAADPKFSVASYSKTSPFRTDVFWSRVLDGLRKAGLPE